MLATARAYSGTESATSFPLTTLTNRYRLSRKIIVSSFSPSVTVKTSCPIIPSYFANSIVYRDFLVIDFFRSEEHTSELQSLTNLVCRLLLEKKNKKKINKQTY